MKRPANGTLILTLCCLALLLVALVVGAKGQGLRDSSVGLETSYSGAKEVMRIEGWRCNLVCDTTHSITTDSLTARVGRLERAEKIDFWFSVGLFIYCFVQIWIVAIAFVDHREGHR